MREAANPVELAQYSLELGPVAERHDGPDRLATDHGGHAVRHEDTIPCEQHLIRSATAAGQDVPHPPGGDALFDLSSLDGTLEAEEPTSFVVDERDAALSVRRHHSFADAVQHRLALLQQRRDVARLETEGLTLQTPREEQRSGDPQAEGERDISADHRHPRENRRFDLVLEKAHRHD